MDHRLAIICTLMITFTLHDARAEDARSLDKIRWILGDWVQAGEKTTARESWSALHRGAFKGIGITTAASSGKVQSEESLILAEMSGAVYYFAKVKQNKYPVPFELTSCSGEHAIFENSEHDFPKKLEYRLTTKDAMKVIVSDGGARYFTIHFKMETDIKRNKE